MKKLIVALSMISLVGIAMPVLPSFSPTDQGAFVVNVAEAAKLGKKQMKEKEKSTEKRVGKLKDLGVPKSYRDDYGEYLSLHEMAEIIGQWIVDFWVANHQLPATITTNPPSWLMIKVNGTCFSESGTCERWEE